MKFIELIKSFKFFDFRKYISANLLVVLFCTHLTVEYIHINTVYPIPIEVLDWGEPHFEYSPEEDKIMALDFISLFATFLLFYLFFIEFLLRIAIEFIVKKFFPKYTNRQILISKFKIPKSIVLTYSFIFYIAFICTVAFLTSGL